MLARLRVGHAHLGFQAQARKRRAQVVRDAGEHDGAVLVEFGELACHAIEADIDLADLMRADAFVQMAGLEVALAHHGGGKGELLERAVDQARDQCRSGHRQCSRDPEPDQPGGAAHGVEG